MEPEQPLSSEKRFSRFNPLFRRPKPVTYDKKSYELDDLIGDYFATPARREGDNIGSE